MSGFTTTGASILERVEALPNSAILWRSITAWLGGMGVITLFIAVLPKLEVGGSQLIMHEYSMPLPEKLRLRVRATARALWSIYIGLTGAQIALLYFAAKLPLFDSINISFSTIATCGFAPTTAGIGGYANPLAEYIIMIFMLAGGTDFLIHYHVWRGNLKVLKDEQFRFYLILLALATMLLVLSQGLGSYRQGLFQAISIMTTAGFANTDFATWNFGARMVLLALMFIGACSGSTGGAIKVSRLLILLKHVSTVMRKAIFPNAVIPVKYNQKALSDGIIRDIISFVFLYFLILMVASIALGFLGLDVETAISAVATCQANCGPGLGAVGPALSYSWVPILGKIILAIVMWLGRLEIFTIIMMFFPRFWKG